RRRAKNEIPASLRSGGGRNASEQVAGMDWTARPESIGTGGRNHWNTHKDAYDLFYVVRNFGSGVEDIADCLRPLLGDPAGSEAVAILRRDFLDHNGVGPRRVAEFVTRGPDDAIQADVVGFVGRLLDHCG
ncbi:MAG: hypothetical protein Q8N51_07625, partial [Gammaproteobacteria bacterium]|nr:hypothetical protein [Gammaproteobacteria bacterium]